MSILIYVNFNLINFLFHADLYERSRKAVSYYIIHRLFQIFFIKILEENCYINCH